MQFAVAVLFLITISAVAAEDACPSTEVVKFAELYANPHLHPCQKVSAGFSLVPPMSYPTEPQVKAMCTAEACRALINDVLALEPADCYLSFSGVKLNAYKMTCSFREACENHTDKEHESRTYEPTPKPTNYKHPTKPKPTEDKHYPSPTEENKHCSTPKPTDDKHYSTSKPTEDKHYSTQKPTDDKHYSTPKPTDDKHYSTPKPTEDKYYMYPTPKPTKDYKNHPTLKPTDDKHHPTTEDGKYHDKPEEPKIVKVDDGDKLRHATRSIGKEADKDVDELKPPMNGTALELFPMPNTTYKASAEPKSA
ncbi:hypothetical protein PF005_g1948 [Phytophthora fragariae]|uniref:Elicitin-like protein n=1 Tax=Phytophthora fragariae TaxID=53985 RepID=A0A6A3G3J7_9STRA|nr:hypothetical protein PF003_g9904 [Phytophthora fragariae]KAE8948508.1 hypothetical protein PF009_g1908 [Phytophthora fragariae]KAE9122654.1 hypothetical protein PF007_g7372 [Phytophthora fragariae]KAE9154543.1 hypothetical protein PF006_g1439 [Phytophthora fragariae]KAE9234308.1 hypothetical protein PF005_g1948 [Phytophthora fragariae]